jgi:hypothetical protein
LPPALVAEAVEREIHTDLADPAERRKDEFVARARHAAIQSVRRRWSDGGEHVTGGDGGCAAVGAA